MQSIQFKRTQTAGKKPTPEQLSQGELAINLADHVLYTKDKNNAVVQISVSPEKHAELNTKVDQNKTSTGFAPIFPDTCYHLTHYWPAAADIPV
ncbi:hypothetical protein, partial [Escherichia coli]|uniref:hypothetical protein n=1 Tax=Escherichia coli TaxID=562 RepID=UPI001FCE4E63